MLLAGASHSLTPCASLLGPAPGPPAGWARHRCRMGWGRRGLAAAGGQLCGLGSLSLPGLVLNELTDPGNVSPGEKLRQHPWVGRNAEGHGGGSCTDRVRATPWPGPEGTWQPAPECVAPLSEAWRLSPTLPPEATSPSATDGEKLFSISGQRERGQRGVERAALDKHWVGTTGAWRPL